MLVFLGRIGLPNINRISCFRVGEADNSDPYLVELTVACGSEMKQK